MTERERWDALVSMVGKRAAYGIAHAGEYDALPFWNTFAPGWTPQRLTLYAWRCRIDEWCKGTGHGVIPPG